MSIIISVYTVLNSHIKGLQIKTLQFLVPLHPLFTFSYVFPHHCSGYVAYYNVIIKTCNTNNA